MTPPRLALFGALLASVAQASPEITWSVMHPTAIDTNYMARVAAKAIEYGGVDSFEVCGDCHRGYSGINGLSMLEKYPHAAAKVDRAAVTEWGQTTFCGRDKLVFFFCFC